MGPENLSMIPVNNAQVGQSAQTQDAVHQTGADLLNSMVQQRLNKLYSTQDELNKQIMNITGAATTPIPVQGTGAVSVPGQHQWPGIPNDNRPTYSHSGSVKLGVANALRGVANVVGALETKHQNDKNKALSVDIERLMEANQGIQSAQEVLKQDPNNKGAQEAIQKNGDLMNAILSDPKKRKQIGKAFDINFVDPSQNNKPEHAALKDAATSWAQQFQSKLPTQMAPNQLAAQKLGQLQETGKLIDSQIKAAMSDKTADAYLRYELGSQNLDEKQRHNLAQEQHWADTLSERSTQFQQRLRQQAQLVRETNQTRLSGYQIAANSRLAAVDRTVQGRLQYAKQHDASEVQMARTVQYGIKNYQDELNKTATVILQAQTLYNDPKASPQDKEAAQKQINETEENQGYLRDQIRALQNQFVLLTGNDFNMGDKQDGSAESTDTDNITIPPVANPRGARPDKPASNSQTPPNPKPVVQTTGPKQDTSDAEYLRIIKEGLSQE